MSVEQNLADMTETAQRSHSKVYTLGLLLEILRAKLPAGVVESDDVRALINEKDISGSFPCLRTKAAQTRGLLGFAVQMITEMSERDAGNRAKLHARAAADDQHVADAQGQGRDDRGARRRHRRGLPLG